MATFSEKKSASTALGRIAQSSAEVKQEQSHITYLDCRGRIEPILMLLEDAGHPYSLDSIPLAQWRDMQAHGKDGPPDFPFYALPTLEQGYAHDGRKIILSETSAILRYFAATLRAPDMSPLPGMPVAEARHDQVLEASLCFHGRFLGAGLKPDWLEQENLQRVWTLLVKPFLSGLEAILHDAVMPPLITSELPGSDARPGTLLSAATVAAAYAVELVASLYSVERIAREYEECMRLRDNVYMRKRIAAWLKASGQLRRDRVAIAPYTSFALVDAAAQKIKSGTLQII